MLLTEAHTVHSDHTWNAVVAPSVVGDSPTINGVCLLQAFAVARLADDYIADTDERVTYLPCCNTSVTRKHERLPQSRND